MQISMTIRFTPLTTVPHTGTIKTGGINKIKKATYIKHIDRSKKSSNAYSLIIFVVHFSLGRPLARAASFSSVPTTWIAQDRSRGTRTCFQFPFEIRLSATRPRRAANTKDKRFGITNSSHSETRCNYARPRRRWLNKQTVQSRPDFRIKPTRHRRTGSSESFSCQCYDRGSSCVCLTEQGWLAACLSPKWDNRSLDPRWMFDEVSPEANRGLGRDANCKKSSTPRQSGLLRT